MTTTTMTKLSLCKATLAGLVLAAGLSGLAAKPAHAEVATVTNTNDSGSGSLRSAIQAANGNPGADTINFNIPGSGVKTIKPSSSLPQITDPLIIDGYTQPGASPNTLANVANGTNAKLMIQLDGSNVGGTGLGVFAPNSVVRGLVINNFDPGAGVNVSTTSSNSKVEGNFIGTDPSGTIDLGNSRGVIIAAAAGTNNTIGGASPAARNLISGNNFSDGIDINTDGNSVLGNLIGTKKDGTTALGNSGNGMRLASFTENNVLGGDDAASANVVAFNGQDGVALQDSAGTGNRILRNSIFSNDEQGIDLSRDGATANDPGDADAGPNALQNKPALASASTSGGSTTTIQGTLNSKPSQTFVVRFFSNPGGGEGKNFVGKKNVTTDSNGNATFAFSPTNAVPVGKVMTATATDSGGNTSEFSLPKTVVAQ